MNVKQNQNNIIEYDFVNEINNLVKPSNKKRIGWRRKNKIILCEIQGFKKISFWQKHLY